MAKDSIPSVHSLDRPEKLQDLLKEDRGDDCLPCKIIGESFRLSSHLNASQKIPVSHIKCSRRWRVPGPRGLQLHLGPVPAREAAGKDSGQRLTLRHAQQEPGHHGHLARPGLARHLEAGQMNGVEGIRILIVYRHSINWSYGGRQLERIAGTGLAHPLTDPITSTVTLSSRGRKSPASRGSMRPKGITILRARQNLRVVVAEKDGEGGGHYGARVPM